MMSVSMLLELPKHNYWEVVFSESDCVFVVLAIVCLHRISTIVVVALQHMYVLLCCHML